MVDEETRRFYERHCATPGGVVIVSCFDDDGDEIAAAIFSDLDKARTWADTQAEESAAAIFTPYIIDEPDYGNVPAEEIN